MVCFNLRVEILNATWSTEDGVLEPFEATVDGVLEICDPLPGVALGTPWDGMEHGTWKLSRMGQWLGKKITFIVNIVATNFLYHIELVLYD